MASDRPNILLITSDQHRGDALGCVGHPCIQTPHLDQLAYEGVRFRNAYVDCPVCIPARTTLVTGIQSHIYGSPSYNADYRIEREREKFLGSLITQAGYQTELVGKTHWHTEGSFRAGFEHVLPLSMLSKERVKKMGRSTNLTGLGGNEILPGLSQFPPELCSTDWVIDRCLDFLETRDKTQPFFLWTSMIHPHPELAIHEPYFSMYDNADIPEAVMGDWVDTDAYPLALYEHRWRWNSGPLPPWQLRKARGVYYGMITNIDHQLGRLFGRLMREDEWDNTLVIYTSDHGEQLGDHGDAGKTTFCESSANVPFIVRPPKGVDIEPGRESGALIEWADILPTLCDVADAEVPDDVTGTSIMPIVDGRAEKVRETLHGQINGSHMFHDGQYKYLYFVEDGKELLFDVTKDRNDAVLLGGEKMDEIRERFKLHLAEEGHEHLTDGELLNQKQEKPPVNRLRAMNPSGWRGAAR